MTYQDILRKYMDIVQEAQNPSQQLDEKWDTETKVSPAERGKYQGRSISDLKKAYRSLKDSGPHPRGSAEYGRMRELAFAIRAKSGWGKVNP